MPVFHGPGCFHRHKILAKGILALATELPALVICKDAKDAIALREALNAFRPTSAEVLFQSKELQSFEVNFLCAFNLEETALGVEPDRIFDVR